MKMIKYMYMCIKHLYVSFSLSVCLMKCNNISCIHFMNFKLVKLNFNLISNPRILDKYLLTELVLWPFY